MSLNSLHKKMEYLANEVPGPIYSIVKSNLSTSIGMIKGQAKLPEPAWVCLEVDILYAAFKHRLWIRLPIFNDVLNDYIKSTYGLTSACTSHLVGDVTATLGAYRTQSTHSLSDEDFLRYIFVQTALAGDEESLIAEMGVGKALIKRLKEAASSLLAGAPEEKSSFIPEIDSSFSRIMIGLSRELKKTPWRLDHYNLYYQILVSVNPEDMTFTLEQVPVMFDLLLMIGQKKRATLHAIETFLQASPVEIASKTITDLFAKLNILYQSNQNQRGQSSSWSLTNLGMSITANAYVQAKLAKARDPLKSLLNAPVPYQVVALRYINDPIVTETLLHDEQISYDTFVEGIKLLVRHNDLTKARRIITDFAAQSPRQPLRKAAIDSIRHLKLNNHETAKSFGDFLVSFATNDASPSVRNAALDAMIKSKIPHSNLDLLITDS